MDSYFSKWIGFQINKDGLNKEQQVLVNINKARSKLRTLNQCGVFKKNFKQEHLLKCVGTFLLPIIEYGLCFFEPDKQLSRRIDVFLNAVIRQLISVPMFTPVVEMRFICQYSDYYSRWHDISSRFLNKLSTKSNQINLLQYKPKIKMRFTLNRQVKMLVGNDYSLWQTIFRNYPKPDNINCPKCHNTHEHVNQYYACHKRQIVPRDIPCTRFNNTEPHIPPRWNPINNSLQRHMSTNDVIIFSDASRHEFPLQATAANLVITANDVYFKVIDCEPLIPDSATKREIAAIVGSLIPFKQHQTLFNIKVFTDCDSALKVIALFRANPLDASSKCETDLLANIHPIPESISFEKVQVHDDANPDNLNHLVDELTHYHHSAEEPPMQVISNFTPGTVEDDQF